MDAEHSWQVIEHQRRALADLLENLAEDQWETPSLCSRWRVRDVAAHVAMAPQVPGIGSMLADAARAGGRFHTFNHDAAVRHASRPTEQIVSELRQFAASRRLPVVTNYRNILFDVLVHAQDIALPLGLDHPMPLEAARAGAQRVWTMGWPFWARRRLRSLRLVATDIDWTAGEGAPVEGPVAALLLLLTGRTALLHQFTGPGAAQLRRITA